MTRSEAQFPAVRGSVPRARRFVAAAVADLPPDEAHAVALIATELAANSVRHAVSGFAVRVEQFPDHIHLEVEDDGSGQPVLGSPGPGATSGRGLQIVSALADAWGVIPKERVVGKTVWVTISLPSEPTAESGGNHERRGRDIRPSQRRSGAPGADGSHVLPVPAPARRPGSRYCRYRAGHLAPGRR